APRVQRGGIDRFALPEEQQQTAVRDVSAQEAVDATFPVALGEGQQVVEVNEREAGAMNQLVHLRKAEVREAHRRIRQSGGAGSPGPPLGLMGCGGEYFSSDQ